MISIPGVIMGPETGGGEYNNVLTEIDYETLSLYIESMQKEKALKYIRKLFFRLNNSHTISYNFLLAIYSTVLSILINETNKRGIPLKEWTDGDLNYFYNFEMINSLEKMKRWIIKVVTDFIDHMEKTEKSHSEKLIKQAKKIVADYISDNISVSEIASYVYVHPNYLSRLFKENEGVPLSEYIINSKLAKARRMLEESGRKVYEIAEAVGYKSSSHFCRIFKKRIGMTPKEYQDLNQ